MSADLRYVIRHTSLFAYSMPISESVMEARMQPRSDAIQRCLRFELTTQPRAKVFSYEDALGNVIHHFDIPGRHSRLSVKADAIVQMSPLPVVPNYVSPDTWRDLDDTAISGGLWESVQWSYFSRETPSLARFADEIGWRREGDPLSMMCRLNTTLFESFKYKSGSTRVDSPIDDALEARAGVCQDLAHIMIALARRVGIPCRYVSGYLSPSAQHDRSAEGATHAWAEAYIPGLDWVGFDPTNNVIAGARHIRVAIGRDYQDVPPTRGVFRGEAASDLAVRVTVSLDARAISRDSPPLRWVAAEPEESRQTADQAQQQQQQ